MTRGRGRGPGRGRGGKNKGSPKPLPPNPVDLGTEVQAEDASPPPKRRRGPKSSTTDPAADEGQVTTQLNASTPKAIQEHPYALRRPGRHPALEAGLVPRPMAEIQAEAAAKRAQAKTIQDAKAAEAMADAAARSENKDKLAVVLVERARFEVEEALYFDTSPPDGKDAGDDEDMYYEEVVNEQRQEEGGGAGQGSPAPTEEARPGAAHPVSMSTATSTNNSSTKRKAAGSGEDESIKKVAGTKKLSPSEKRTLRREEVLEDLSQRRQIQAPPGSANSPSAVQPSAARLANSAPAITHQKDTTQTSKSAFHPNWRRSLQGQSRSQSATPSTNHSKTPGSARSGTPQTSKNQHPNGSRRPATAARYVEDDDPDFEELGGLRDVDVAADRNATLANVNVRKGKGKENGFIINAVSEKAERKKKKPKGEKQATKRVAHDSDGHDATSSNDDKSDCDSDKGLKYDALPNWTKPVIKTQIVPSILEHLGAQDDPWDNDTPQYTFIELVQRYIDDLFPQRHHTLVKKDVIYRWCRQQAYDWRRGFEKAANTAIANAIELRRNDKALTLEQRAEDGIYQWVCNATKLGGEAMFGQPNIAEPGQAKGQLQSPYVLQVVAYHLKSIIGTINEDGDSLLPVGAISLAAAAVERTFRWHVNHQQKGLPRLKFNRLRAGGLTGQWRETGVQDLVDHPRRLQSLLDRALLLVPDNEKRSTNAKEISQGMGVHYSLYQRERSSSPAEAFGSEDM